MGSWLSIPAGAGNISGPGGNISVPRGKLASIGKLIGEIKEELSPMSAIGGPTNGASEDIGLLVYSALKHYNSNHPGAEFGRPAQRQAACVGFRKNLWYHVNFSARSWTDDNDQRTFFAELCYHNSSNLLVVQTCIVLEKPFITSSTCAMCPHESKILHPDDAGFVCGKEGHESEFFRERCSHYGDGKTKEFFSQRDMLRTPFLLGGPVPAYRLVED